MLKKLAYTYIYIYIYMYCKGTDCFVYFNILFVYIIIIFIYCNWVVTPWQWLFYMYTEYEIGYY